MSKRLCASGAAAIVAAAVGAATPVEAGEAIEVTAGVLNTRTGPSTGNTVIGQTHRGEVYPVLGRSGSWVKLQFDRRSSWSYSPYTRKVSRTIHQVTASTLNVRSGPSTGYRIVGRLGSGAKVVTIGSSGSWRKICHGGRTAWVHGNYLRTSSSGSTAPSGPTHEVTASVLNMRSGPGTSYGIKAQLSRGTRVTSRRKSGSWHEVDTPKGRGWVHGNYLGPIGSSSTPTSSAGFINLPASGRGFYAYQASSRRWGTPTMIYGLQRAARRYKNENASRPRIGIGDISKASGGYFPPHVSHRYGKDVDVRPSRRDGREGPTQIGYSSYSRSLTRRAIEFMRAELPVKLILFNDTAIPGVQWYRGHHNHFHLRTHR